MRKPAKPIKPMGLTQWAEHGKANGYWHYFEGQMKENIVEEIFTICAEIEQKTAQVAGIKIMLSDYWMVSIQDWTDDAAQEELVLEWIAEKYKLNEERLGCFMHDSLMVLAVYVYLHRKDQGRGSATETKPYSV